jgi:hypothetical protein
MDRRTDLPVSVMANINRVSAAVLAGGTPRARHVRETFAHA